MSAMNSPATSLAATAPSRSPAPATVHGTTTAATTTTNMACPICLEDDIDGCMLLSTCQHQACRTCLQQWFQVEETTGQDRPTCPVDGCRAPVGQEDAQQVLGRTFVPAGSYKHNNQKKRKRAPTTSTITDTDSSAATTAGDDDDTWLTQSGAIRCGGCDTWIMKLDGCDKVQCVCGFRICWNCKTVAARCPCTPKNHGFVDNITGLPDFAEARHVLPKQQLTHHVKQQAAVAQEQRQGFPAVMFSHYFRSGGLSNHSHNHNNINLATNTTRQPFAKRPKHPTRRHPPLPQHLLQPLLPQSTPQLSLSEHRRNTILQRILQDDLASAIAIYQAELQHNQGQPPLWATTLKTRLQHLDSDTVVALFPGVHTVSKNTKGQSGGNSNKNGNTTVGHRADNPVEIDDDSSDDDDIQVVQAKPPPLVRKKDAAIHE